MYMYTYVIMYTHACTYTYVHMATWTRHVDGRTHARRDVTCVWGAGQGGGRGGGGGQRLLRGPAGRGVCAHT